MNIDDFEKSYHEFADLRGGVSLLPPEMACKYIHDGISKNFELLGIDAFRVLGKKIQPIMEYGTSSDRFKGSNKEFGEMNVGLIKSIEDSDIWFEVIFGEK